MVYALFTNQPVATTLQWTDAGVVFHLIDKVNVHECRPRYLHVCRLRYLHYVVFHIHIYVVFFLSEKVDYVNVILHLAVLVDKQ